MTPDALTEIGPFIMCYHCGQQAFIHQATMPQMPTVLECSICSRKTYLNIVGFKSALEVADAQ